MVALPIWCRCGKIVTYAPPERRCEDCFVNDTVKSESKQCQRVQVPHLSAKQMAEIDRRTAYINEVFRTGRSHAFLPPNAIVRPGRRAAR